MCRNCHLQPTYILGTANTLRCERHQRCTWALEVCTVFGLQGNPKLDLETTEPTFSGLYGGYITDYIGEYTRAY